MKKIGAITQKIFPFQRPMNASSFALWLLLLYALYGLTFNIYEIFSFALPAGYNLHSLLSEIFPLILVYMICEILTRRWRSLAPENLFIQYIIVVCFLLFLGRALGVERFLADQLGLDGAIRDVFSFTTVSFFVFAIFGLLIAAMIYSVTEYFFPKWTKKSYDFSSERVSGGNSEPFVLLSVIVLILLFNGCIGFDSLTGDPFRTHQELLNYAKSGSRKEQMRVAGAYAEGIGTEKDLALAIHWYSVAFKEGNADAAYYAGVAYDEQGDAKSARDWYLRAASKGSDRAAQKLGSLTVSEARNSLDKNTFLVCRESKAVFDLAKCRQRAIAGDARAQYQYAKTLARNYSSNRDVLFSNISFWYEQAAIAGDRDAQNELALLFQRGGEDQRRDLAKAAKWYIHMGRHGRLWLLPRGWFLNLLRN